MMSATRVIKSIVLKIGARGPEVVDLQNLLLIVGGVSRRSIGAIDGVFGVRTKAAVLHFQKTRGLRPDGIVGKLTWERLAPTSEWPNSRVGEFLRRGDRGAESLQEGLRRIGYYNGAIDGVFGALTHAAVYKLQTSAYGVGANTEGVVGPMNYRAATVSIQPGGLRFRVNGMTVQSGNGENTTLLFGADIDQVLSAVKGYFFRSPQTTVETRDCRRVKLTIYTFVNGLVLIADHQGKFAGWRFPNSPGRPILGRLLFSVNDGVSIGSSVDKLKENFDDLEKIESATLGIGFRSAQLTGLLTANEPDAIVKELWAGENCIDWGINTGFDKF